MTTIAAAPSPATYQIHSISASTNAQAPNIRPTGMPQGSQYDQTDPNQNSHHLGLDAKSRHRIRFQSLSFHKTATYGPSTPPDFSQKRPKNHGYKLDVPRSRTQIQSSEPNFYSYHYHNKPYTFQTKSKRPQLTMYSLKAFTCTFAYPDRAPSILAT
ncbi:Hypothetical_protein [Hexamita inflata]|uniref:Hypothetical_protein n=1 Tax=Hexamita inflata TaxID=28002 RepID=A0AA86PTI2_9EUKA|nr:Hypothetical protein HINF_LOCUS33559 [Hexamita inflata]